MERLLLTVPQAAEALALGRTSIYRLIDAGELHPVHIGRAVRVSAAEVKDYFNRLLANQEASITQITERQSARDAANTRAPHVPSDARTQQ